MEIESQILVDVDVLAGDAPDATGLAEQVQRAEANAGESVAETLGDCAYGSGATREEFAEANRVLLAKVPQESRREGCFPKSRFGIDLEANTVTCPAGHTTGKYTQQPNGGKLFHFGTVCAACPLRTQCTTAQGGRQLQVHPQEGLLQAARAFQQTPAGRAKLRERVVIEHRLARLGQLGVGQARYCGRKKVRFQVLIAATIANLRRTWNWSAAQTAPEPPGTTPSVRGAVARWLHRLVRRLEWRPLVHENWVSVAAGAA